METDTISASLVVCGISSNFVLFFWPLLHIVHFLCNSTLDFNLESLALLLAILGVDFAILILSFD